jgi:inorganic pyrophosphatase
MLHAWHDVSPGDELPRDFQAVIEIPLGSNVKYELDKPSGLLKVDRIIHFAVFCPANYGLIPQTYAEDNGPLDVLVLCQEPVQPLAPIKARAIGLMSMIDSGASDDKIIAVATGDPEFSSYIEARPTSAPLAGSPPFLSGLQPARRQKGGGRRNSPSLRGADGYRAFPRPLQSRTRAPSSKRCPNVAAEHSR